MKYLTHPYPIRPRPKKDELYLGYIVRIAAKNGRKELYHLFRDFNANYQVQCFFVRSEAYYRVLPYFADAVNIPKGELNNYFKRDALLISIASKTFYRTKVGHPVFCPHCLHEQGYIKSKWLYLHINHCEIHNCKLHHRCPFCDALQEWESSLLKQCTACETPWAEADIQSCTLPAYERSLATMGHHQEVEYLERLYYFVMFAMRPFDASHAKFHKVVENLEDTSEYFSYAHKLASFEFVRREFAQHRKRQFTKDLKCAISNKILDPLNTRIEAANDKHFKTSDSFKEDNHQTTECKPPVEVTDRILTVNRRLHHASNDNRYHLDWADSQKLLSMSKATIMTLIERGVFERRVHHTSSNKLLAPPLNEVVALSNKLNTLVNYVEGERSENLISWQQLRAHIGKTKTISDVFIALLESKLQIYAHNSIKSVVVSDLLFDETEIIQFKSAA
mgnify:CR=1 FL=1